MKTYVFGAAGHAKEIIWLIDDINAESAEKMQVQSLVEPDDSVLVGTFYNGIPIISEAAYFQQTFNEKHYCVLAIGSSQIRKKVYDKVNLGHAVFPKLIHPNVIYDAAQVSFDEGVIVCANAMLTTNIRIGKLVHINIAATVSHDTTIDDFTTLSPGVHIAGNVKVGSTVFFGIGAVTVENITIASDVVIGAAAAVTQSILTAGTYVGVPAKKIK